MCLKYNEAPTLKTSVATAATDAMRGVRPEWSMALMSAPNVRSLLTATALAQRAAKCNGVSPVCVFKERNNYKRYLIKYGIKSNKWY